MFKSLKEKIRPSRFAEKLGHISEIGKSENGDFAVILRLCDIQRAKHFLISGTGSSKGNVRIFLKTEKKNEENKNAVSDKEIADSFHQSCTLETFKSYGELFTIIKGKDFKRIFIYYADKMDSSNLFFEIAGFRGKTAEVIGVDKNNDAHRLPRKYYRHKFAYTILRKAVAVPLRPVIRISVFALLFLILAPFVALFWVIMLLLMILSGTGKKEAS